MTESIAAILKTSRSSDKKKADDRQLLRLCEEYEKIQDKINSLYDENSQYYIENDRDRDINLSPLEDKRGELREKINSIPAYTVKGILARARALVKTFPDLVQEADNRDSVESMVSATLRDITQIQNSDARLESLSLEQQEALMSFARDVYCAAEGCLQMALQVVPPILNSLPVWDHAGARETVQKVKVFSNELESLVSARIELQKIGVNLWQQQG